MPNCITLSDLNSSINNEPRVAHQKLAKALGFKYPHKFKHLIERNIEELQRYGEIVSTVDGIKIDSETNPKGAGRKGVTLWLNEPQSVISTLRSDAPKAPDARQEVVEVFIAYRHGQIKQDAPLWPQYKETFEKIENKNMWILSENRRLELEKTHLQEKIKNTPQDPLLQKLAQAHSEIATLKGEITYLRGQMKTFFVWIDKLIMEGRGS